MFDRVEDLLDKNSSQMVNTKMAAAHPQFLQYQQQMNSHKDQQQSNGQQSGSSRAIIERGASWSYNETRILLSLWGQDMVQRQLTNSKRTRHVWEKIAERIREHGYDRTADQVRTRVFNMIAEYRRILKNPTPERKKKCIFFDALHKIYQAKDAQGVKMALNNYEEDYNFNEMDGGSQDDHGDRNHRDDLMDAENSGTDGEDRSEFFAYAMSPSHVKESMSMGLNDDSIDDNGNMSQEDLHFAHPSAKRARRDSMVFQQAFAQPLASLDPTSSALLIDRMFSHLAKETEVMRDWVSLERERMDREAAQRREDAEREERREQAFLNTLMKMQEQMFRFLSKQPLSEIPAFGSESMPQDSVLSQEATAGGKASSGAASSGANLSEPPEVQENAQPTDTPPNRSPASELSQHEMPTSPTPEDSGDGQES